MPPFFSCVLKDNSSQNSWIYKEFCSIVSAKTRKGEEDMPRLINKHFGMIVSVEPTEKSKDDEGWIWRKDYEGFIGVISIYESRSVSKGQHFIVMNNDTRYIKTGVGKITYTRILNESFIILETTNIIYTIKLHI